jgi:hypothetical protein
MDAYRCRVVDTLDYSWDCILASSNGMLAPRWVRDAGSGYRPEAMDFHEYVFVGDDVRDLVVG